MDEKISVIIPVYNVEKYLCECLDSVLAQTYTNLEIVLVDDGSTDSSGTICDKYAGKDSRIHVIHQKNGGLSAARNAGLNMAKGEYIAFVDADDLIHPQFLELMLNGIRQSGCPLSICCFRRFWKEEAIEFEHYDVIDFPNWSKTALLAMLNDFHNDEALPAVVAWSKLYRAELFQNIRFPLGKWHEDEFIAHHILAQCDGAVFIQKPLYGYRQNPDGYMLRTSGKVDFSHLSRIDALVDRTSLFSKIAPELVSDSVHHLLWECNSNFAFYGKVNRRKYCKQRKWMVQTFRRTYWKNFSQLSGIERVKGGVFAVCPEGYSLLAAKKAEAKQ